MKVIILFILVVILFIYFCLRVSSLSSMDEEEFISYKKGHE